RVTTTVRPSSIGWTVTATWEVDRIRIGRDLVGGREAVTCRGLNDYSLFVTDGHADAMVPRLLATLKRRGVGAKAAVIERGGPLPTVWFLNSAGVHGAAPLSGLIVLAQAREAVPEIAEAFGDSTS